MSRRACLLTLVAFLALGVSALGGLAIAQETKKVYDPVCGMEAGKDTPHVTEYNGKKYSFCSEKCRAEFLKDPAKLACFCLSGSDCPHCTGKSATCPCEKKTHDHAHEHGKHKGGD